MYLVCKSSNILLMLLIMYNLAWLCFLFQADSPEYRAACKLWDVFLATKSSLHGGDIEDDDEEEESEEVDNPGVSTEEEVKFPP